jgi:hypothetical protein
MVAAAAVWLGLTLMPWCGSLRQLLPPHRSLLLCAAQSAPSQQLSSSRHSRHCSWSRRSVEAAPTWQQQDVAQCWRTPQAPAVAEPGHGPGFVIGPACRCQAVVFGLGLSVKARGLLGVAVQKLCSGNGVHVRCTAAAGYRQFMGAQCMHSLCSELVGSSLCVYKTCMLLSGKWYPGRGDLTFS